MLDWLHSLPNLAIGSVIVAATVGLCIVLPYAVRRGFRLEVSPDVAKGAEEGFKLMASMTMAILAFGLVQEQTFHRNMEDLAAREATIVLKLDRHLGEFGAVGADGPRRDLRAYALSVIRDEWPLLASGARADETSRRWKALVEASSGLTAATEAQQESLAEIRGELIQVSDVRDARLSATQMSLPAYYWLAISAVLVILVVVGWFQGPLPKMVIYVGGVSLGIAMLLTLLIVASGVFAGESRVAPTALLRALPLLGS